MRSGLLIVGALAIRKPLWEGITDLPDHGHAIRSRLHALADLGHMLLRSLDALAAFLALSILIDPRDVGGGGRSASC
jgi:hypothetical protein